MLRQLTCGVVILFVVQWMGSLTCAGEGQAVPTDQRCVGFLGYRRVWFGFEPLSARAHFFAATKLCNKDLC